MRACAGRAMSCDLLPIPQDFGGDGFTRIEFEIDDEIGNRDLRIAVDEEHEVLVLDRDARLRSRVIANAAEARFADCKAAAQFATHVGDLAGEDEQRRCCR